MPQFDFMSEGEEMGVDVEHGVARQGGVVPNDDAVAPIVASSGPAPSVEAWDYTRAMREAKGTIDA